MTESTGLHIETMLMKILLFMMVLLTGCEHGEIVFTEESRNIVKENNKKRMIKKMEIFYNCLNLAANIKRKGDDDVSDIINECNIVASYAVLRLF